MKSSPIFDYRFSEKEIKQLIEYRDKQEDFRLKQRFLVFLFSTEGVPQDTICKTFKISPKTIGNWFKQYLQKGIDALNIFNYVRKKPFLTKEQIKNLKKWIKENAPGNRETIKDFIWKSFGISYTVSGISRLLKKCGIHKIKPKLIPGKPPSLAKQYGFILYYLMLRKLQRHDESMVQLFVDGMHLVHQVIPTFYWGSRKDRLTFNTNSSQNRLNILGAYDVQTHTLVHLTSEANCDADKVIEFLELICKVYHDKDTITLHMDNAPYFHAKKVRNGLKKHPQIVINALPVYAPNLNLIERLWRFVKGEWVRNRYHEKYKTFRAKVFRLLNNLENYTDKLKTLITDNFEIVQQK